MRVNMRNTVPAGSQPFAGHSWGWRIFFGGAVGCLTAIIVHNAIGMEGALNAARHPPIAALMGVSYGPSPLPGVSSGAPVAEARPAALVVAGAAGGHGDVMHGNMLFHVTCHACHGTQGQGVRGLGAALRGSSFISAERDADLVRFIKAGRQPADPKSLLHLTMPPKGANPDLGDADLLDIVSFLRTLQSQPAGSSH